MNNVRQWFAPVGRNGIEAAQHAPRKTLHPDAGGGEQDFVMLTELTNWIKEELGKKQWGCRMRCFAGQTL